MKTLFGYFNTLETHGERCFFKMYLNPQSSSFFLFSLSLFCNCRIFAFRSATCVRLAANSLAHSSENELKVFDLYPFGIALSLLILAPHCLSFFNDILWSSADLYILCMSVLSTPYSCITLLMFCTCASVLLSIAISLLYLQASSYKFIEIKDNRKWETEMQIMIS